ncbi:TonB-dependent receptor [Variovorax sp.]|uniref:TonB-dependent siderophore receptor n=1 Tax=Variovorax sp. TaxID=1871043 RepID=UPI00137FFC1D|nr:TonB-dependent receptor [Variovorax sp.]KAF1061546.1 MAG: Fe(3+)-pyochelin receptor [Variovorax sp.]
MPSSFASRHRFTAIAFVAALAAALPPAIAQAADAPASQAIAAGPLSQALYSFASANGITLSFDPALTEGLRSPGLEGGQGIEQGLRRLLAGSGLEAVPVAPGNYRLRKAAADGAAASGDGGLAPVVVTARGERSALTEGSGSYAARAVTVAGKTPTPWKDVPNSVSVITRQQMDDQNMTTVEDALRQTVGVTAIPYGDGTAYFQSRGYASEVQYDGLPFNNGIQYLRQFDLSMYDRVEVFRGPAGVLQGSGTPAGTVNLVRKRPLAEPAISGLLSAGSWNQHRGEIDISRPLNEAGTVRGRALLSSEGGDTFRTQGTSRHTLGYAIVEADLGPRSTLSLSGSVQPQHDRGIDYGPGTYTNGSFLNAPRKTFFGTDWSGSSGTAKEVYAEFVHRFDDDWVAKAAYIRRSIDGDSRYGYINGLVRLDNRAAYTLQAQSGETTWQGLDLNLAGSFRLWGRKHDLLIGANHSKRDETSLSGSVGIPQVDIYNLYVPDRPIPFRFGSNTRSEQSGLYGQTRLRLADPLTLVLGGRVSHYRSESQTLLPTPGAWKSDAGGVNHKFSPYGGLVYELRPDISLYGSYSDIFIPQTQLAVGNAALLPRVGRQFEIGTKGSFMDGRLNASLAAFRIEDRNRAVTDPDNPGFFVAEGKVRSQGWEAEVSGRLARGWDLYAGYTRLDTRYADDPSNAGKPFSSEEPRHTVKLWTRYEFQQPSVAGLHVGLGVRAVSKTDRGAAVQGGYAVADAQVGYRFNKNLSLTLDVHNLFDRFYYARLPSRFYSVYGDPRNVRLTLRASY